MIKTIKPLARRALACLLAVLMVADPVAAATVTISSVPLATSSGANILPNLLFTLDSSGSMGWNYLPDYVNDTNKCLSTSSGGTSCQAGDPPFYAADFNGVAYNPNVYYKPGLTSSNTTVLSAPLDPTAVPDDAYGAQSTSNTNVTTSITDRQFCNSNNVCKRNGADSAGTTLTSGTDAAGNTVSAGRFPYRTHASNSSTQIFGLPEMMPMGNFSRSGTTVTVTTTAAHGLSTGDVIYVTGASTSSLNTNAVAVTRVNANSFTYTSGSSGTAASQIAQFRKHSTGSWTRSASVVTVSASNHGLVANDVIIVAPASSFTAGTFTVVSASTNSFTYASSTGTGTVSGTWVRSGLYNVASTASGPPPSYFISPTEYCSDEALTNCTQTLPPPATAPSGYPYPAPVRFCQTREQAFSPDVVTTASGTPACRSKYVGSGTTQWIYPRYGWFNRDTIRSAVTSYSNRSNRSDCVAAPTCTYTEEIQNYARWWTYYQTRMQMMKTAAGRAFVPFVSNPSASPAIANKLKIGFITINPFYPNGGGSQGSSVNSSQYLRIAPFDTTQASNWYTKFYAQVPNNGTPLQEALSRAGWIFSGKLNQGLTSGIPNADDPMEASCQRNFTLMTTDGYWNGNYGQDLAGNTGINVDNVDNLVVSPYTQIMVDRANTVTFDGGLGSVVVTTTTPTYTNQQVFCQGNNNTTFSSGAQTACGCPLDQHRVVQRTLVSNSVTVTTNGTITSGPTTSAGSPIFTNITGCSTGSWAKASQPKLSTEIMVCSNSSSSGSGTVTFADGSNVSCQFCATSGNRRIIIKQVLNFSTDAYTVDSVSTGNSTTTNSVTYSYSSNGTTYTTTVPTSSSSCTSTSASTLNGYAQSAAVTNNGSVVNTSGTGTTLAVTISPNPSAATTGSPSASTASGYPDTLADVAMYYYRTDLRGGTDYRGNTTGPSTNLGGTGTVDVSPNNLPVKSGSKDFVTHQHMVTFTVGLADGFMKYKSDYETSGTGDYANIKAGTSNACFWTTGVCNWPQPIADDQSALDDLWHAAVNGRGQFYQALNVDSLVQGIGNTLTSVNTMVASAAASATSSPNVTQSDNQIFSTTYETNTWAGRVFAQTIDPTTGNVNSTIQWEADTLLLAKVSASSDTRTIYTLDTSTSTKLKPFAWASLTGTQQGYFNNKCVPASTLTQCAGLNTGQLATANDGATMLGFLRGWTGNEGTIFRNRSFIDTANNNAIIDTVMGDTISAKPAFVRNPTFSYADAVTPSYNTFATANATRQAMVYVAANDGYLHAFNATTGVETWAYTPSFMMSQLYQLADTGYATAHRYYVDGSPETGDVFDTTASAWKTIIVGGLGGGGSGFYALDVTDPANPKGLWEFCSDSTLCAKNDADLGLSFGNPVIGKRSYDGRWVVVVTSGLNNTTTGLGYFYVLDAITGQVLNKISTGVGTAVSPSGLMKIAPFFSAALTDASFQYVYGGDQLGNVWRLDMSTATPTVMHMTVLKDASSPTRAQPITTKPALTHIGSDRIIYVGTGRFLGAPDLTDPGSGGVAWQQSIYAFKDKNQDYQAAPLNYANLRADPNMVHQTLTSLSAGNRGVSTNAVDWSAKDGWYVDFNPTFSGVQDSPGEGVNLVDPRLVLGTLLVTTNAPSQGSSSCSVGGNSFAYNFDFKTGQAVASSAGGVVGRSLGGTITVGVAVVQIPSGAIKSINTGADTTKTTQDVNTSASGSSVSRFSYRVR